MLFFSELTKGFMDNLIDFESQRPRRFKGRKMPINPRIVVQSASFLAILFISTTYWLTIQSRKRKQAETQLKNEHLDSELKFLKSQVNPHFLFNALNNIYSLSYTGSTKAPTMIMKLSEMMRYVLYESNEEKVSLEKEITYINHFIDFQKLKIEGSPNITLEVDNVDSSILLEPMLFIPFIENSFKHSKIEDTKESWIKIKISTQQQEIRFNISNSIARHGTNKDNTGGIGLENVRKRLQLLYPDRHELKITQDEQEFSISLIILI